MYICVQRPIVPIFVTLQIFVHSLMKTNKGLSIPQYIFLKQFYLTQDNIIFTIVIFCLARKLNSKLSRMEVEVNGSKEDKGMKRTIEDVHSDKNIVRLMMELRVKIKSQIMHVDLKYCIVVIIL